MIQIRQKKQNLRNQRRKQFLQNHFKNLRKRHFNFDNSVQPQDLEKDIILRSLLDQSLNPNSLVCKIREGNLINELNLLTLEAIQNNNKSQAKYLLTIFSNIFKDEINPFEKEELFKISIRLFESLKISYVKFEIIEQRKQFSQTLQLISSDILSYYISSIFSQSQYLEQVDQQLIEKIVYPAFVNILFHTLRYPKLIGLTQNFCTDVERSISTILDLKQQQYEMGNKYKVKRNQNFFVDIMMRHYFFINQKNVFPQNFLKVQSILFWLYDKLTDYFHEIDSLFHKKEFWLIIEHSFKQQFQRINSTNIIHIYSILRTLIDGDNFINEINCMMLEINQLSNFCFINDVIASIQNGQKQMYEVLQFLEGILINNLQTNNFQKLIEMFHVRFMEMLVKILMQTEKSTLAIDQNRRIVNKILAIVFIFIEKGNKTIKEKQNQFSICFQKLQGRRKIQQISTWFGQMDQDENSDISSICEFIGWILLQSIQFSVDS